MINDGELVDLIKNQENVVKMIQKAEERSKKMFQEANNIAEIEIQEHEKKLLENFNKKNFSTKEFEDEINKKTKEEIHLIYENYNKNENKVIDLFNENIVNINLQFPRNLQENLEDYLK